MSSYGNIFEFFFDSQNGAEIRIIISQQDYVGKVYRRPLGRAPLLRRDNNDRIFGTSIEIYAECIEDGEYATLYSSSAYEHMVDVYKDDTLLWTGFVSPELYSEPDMSPPYDVQIIATDGLGELKNYEFRNAGTYSVRSHIRSMLAYTGADLQYDIVSALRYSAGDDTMSLETELLDFAVSLDHEVGNSCYDVLQRLLAGMNMSITQYLGRWLLFRETDLISLASSDGIEAYDINGYSKTIPVASFGSADDHEWWPVGQLSSVIEPAKNRIVLKSPNHYRNNVFDPSDFVINNGAYFDEDRGVYILPDEGSNISQVIDFSGIEVGYRLALRVKARNVGSGDEDQDLGIMIKINGRGYPGRSQYWLVQTASSDRGVGAYQWRSSEGSILSELAVPSDSDTPADAQDIDIILPLYRFDLRSYMYATSVEVTVFNPAGTHDIHIYDVALGKYDQFSGYQANVLIGNNAREEASTVDLSLTAGDTIPSAGYVFMSGIPLLPELSTTISQWATRGVTARDYISFMAYDYSRAIALPKLSYKGILNVPTRSALPLLFLRDGTYYLARTYSYNLADDEVEIDLISISAANVSIVDIKKTTISESQGTMPAGSSGGNNGGIGSSAAGNLKLEDLRDVELSNVKEGDILRRKGLIWVPEKLDDIIEEYLANTKKLGDWFGRDEHGIFTHKNFRSTGTVSSGGAAQVGEGGGSSGGTTGEYKMYVHNQGDPLQEWTIVHNMNKVPNVKIIDSTGNQVYGDVKIENMNIVTVSFGGAFSGIAYLD